MAIGSIEPQFYAQLLERTGITDPAFAEQLDAANWPRLKARLGEVFLTRTRDEWCALMEGSDVCFAPVLSIEEAAAHPHNVARNLFPRNASGLVYTQAAPRFSTL